MEIRGMLLELGYDTVNQEVLKVFYSVRTMENKVAWIHYSIQVMVQCVTEHLVLLKLQLKLVYMFKQLGILLSLLRSFSSSRTRSRALEP